MFNATPHNVIVISLSGQEWVYPASGEQARVSVSSREEETLDDGCPTTSVSYGEATLPPGAIEAASRGEGVIVSTMFADAYRKQNPESNLFNLFVPDSGPTAIRENGQVKAVRNLIRR